MGEWVGLGGRRGLDLPTCGLLSNGRLGANTPQMEANLPMEAYSLHSEGIVIIILSGNQRPPLGVTHSFARVPADALDSVSFEIQIPRWCGNPYSQKNGKVTVPPRVFLGEFERPNLKPSLRFDLKFTRCSINYK